MKIYVAGPYTRGDVVENVRQAIVVGDQLIALGHTPFIPHLCHYWNQYIPHDYDYWIRYTMKWLKECDALIRIPGYSPGSDEEENVMMQLGRPIYRNLQDVPYA